MVEPTVPDMPERVPDVAPPAGADGAPWRTVAKWAAIAVAALVALAGLAVLGLNTAPGRALVVQQINRFTLASGLNFRVGKIEGSLYGAMVLHDVEARDPKGVFARAEQIALDWRPFAYLGNRIDVRSLASPRLQVARLPELIPQPRDPNAPLLPDMDIDVARLDLARVEIAEAVTGRRHVARLAGTAHISDGRAEIDLQGATIRAPGVVGGDQVAVRIDAVPEADKLDIAMRVNAPQGGLVAGLAGLEAPLTLSVDGTGSWRSWKGRAVSTLGTGELADLAIEARDGLFQVRGPTRPGLWLEGPVERLASPQLDVMLDAAWKDRRADTRFRLRSDALQLSGQGLLDFAKSRFGDFRVEGMLLTPGAIAPNFNGRSVRVAVALDGPFARPVVDYKLQAAALGFGETVVEGLVAEGRARVDADRILVPINARAARVSGLNAAAGGLLTNVRIGGDVAISGGHVLSDNLRIDSDRVQATAIVAADIATGRYTGALKGRVNEYQIDGIGIVNVTTDAELYAAPGGGWGIRGQVAGRSVRLFNDGIRDFLGGNAVASVRLGYRPDGIVTFDRVTMRAPDFRILRGSGRYDPAGPILIDADAVSDRYGPISARVTGTMAAPEVLLRADRPGLGIGLEGLVARVRGSGERYAVTAQGGTAYGPFVADVLVGTAGPITVDVRSGRFAGMNITGRIRQTGAGPFAGVLSMAGSGINGTVALDAVGSTQRLAVDATAYNAIVPGSAGLTIGRAIVDAKVLLADTPQIDADVQVANLRLGTLVLRAARTRIDYQGGRGAAQAFATGSTGVPFQIAANARMAPDQWLVALRGQGSGIGFQTSSPARIAIAGGSYRLLPTRVDFDRGSVRLAGTYGDGMAVQARLDKLDLALINALVPNVGLGGTATGALDFTQAGDGAFPRAEARIDIANFTRSSLAQVSTPVNVSFVGRLVPDGGDARAIVRRGTTPVGRMIATLRPLPPGAGRWQERLLAAPLSGGVRYNGPAAVLFSLGGFAGQQLSGPIAVAADFSGRVRAPELTGIVRASRLTYENEVYGTRLTDLAIDGTFSNDQFVLNSARATAGEGTVQAAGRVGLAADQSFPMRLTAELRNARLARSEALGATATGNLSIIREDGRGRIEGRLTIPEARYRIIRQGSAEVPELTGVRRKSDYLRERQRQRDDGTRAGATGSADWALALNVRADNQLLVEGMGLESEWQANITVGGTTAAPRIGGTMEVVRGTYSFAGRRFDVTRGTIRFAGSQLTNPSIDITATTTAEGVNAILNVGGTAQQPRITFSSSPSLPQDEVLSRLLFGSSVTDLSATEAIQLAAAVNSLSSSGGGLNPLGKLRSAAGIDRLRILSADDTSGRGTALAAGQYITNDIYIEIITDARGFTATQLEVALSRALSVLSQTGSFGGSSVSLRYSRDY